MKEYKVVNPKLGMSRRNEKLEDVLNQYAREGWHVCFIGQNAYMVVFERDKNR
ncbi:MAG: DUF4177 domain-containing protein [Bacteroidia bacterium]|nr:DUF4177 domain-containing protein [Bacteroidia bacterium]MBT8268634.1 DUF4177 domain-containing protein [Bacteroidia bacterium]NNF81381.1 DUF4177 domain-containing protein [Flavobacteriaceae bacterium]NNK69420.1 DUF4177 domain-containing protein [Flavobacteriaceae bacterium]NNL79478.1 DUF4177 domain-containing protein [Flavobacteriaceae bacterium]